MTPTELATTLEPMFACLASRRDDDDIKRYIAGCAFALSDVPIDAVQVAVRRYCQGEVAGHEARWRPEPAELAKLAREIDKPARLRREREAKRVAAESMARLTGPQDKPVSRERKLEIMRNAGIEPVEERRVRTRQATRRQLENVLGRGALDAMPDADDTAARKAHLERAKAWETGE